MLYKAEIHDIICILSFTFKNLKLSLCKMGLQKLLDLGAKKMAEEGFYSPEIKWHLSKLN